ncbi:MAG: zinc ribbon domain-containing protein [Planctomycetaceae bacterium]|nr:zinc ribbon domain-containing protein [Planctomycetaceae bacterium]
MPIKVVCKCGASFAAKDELAGRAVSCPKCKQPLRIPAPAAAPQPAASGMDDLFDEVGISAKKGASCPKCHAELKPNAVLCVACGFDLQSGEHREGAKIQAAGRGGHDLAADDLLARAARQIEIDKEEDKKNLTHGAPAYVYLFGLVVIVAFAGMMFTLPKGLAFYITGWSLVVFVGVIQVYYGIRMVIVAFQEGPKYGFLHFVPFYSLYYLITRWDRVGKWFMKSLGMIPLAIFGGLLVGLGLLLGLTHQEKEDSWLYDRPRHPAVCLVEPLSRSSHSLA